MGFIIACEDDSDVDGAAHIVVRSIKGSGDDEIQHKTVSTGLGPMAGSGARYWTAACSDVAACRANGDFVVVWEDDRDGNGLWQIMGRGYHRDGQESLREFTINSVAKGQQEKPKVAIADNGDFVVVWQDDQGEDNLFEVYARGFNADGTEKFHDMTVNSYSVGLHGGPAVSMTPDGEIFVVAWHHRRNQSDGWQIYARSFWGDGTGRIFDRAINSVSKGVQIWPDVGVANDGSFVVVWSDDEEENGYFNVFARGFYANGQEKFHDFMVNTETAGDQKDIKVAVGPAGNFICVWDDAAYLGTQLHNAFYRAFHPDGSEHIGATKAFPLIRYYRPAVSFQSELRDPSTRLLKEIHEWARGALPDDIMARDFGL